jgi:hypothetical protein
MKAVIRVFRFTVADERRMVEREHLRERLRAAVVDRKYVPIRRGRHQRRARGK